MKKLFYFFAMAVFGLITSCSNDDSDSNSNNAIVGTWGITSMTVKGNLVRNGQTAPIDQTQNVDACVAKSTSTFKADGTGNDVLYSLGSNGNCNLMSNQNFTYTYNASTKVLTETANGASQSITLSALTSTTMSYGERMNNTNMGMYDPQLEGYYFTGTMTMNFTKK